jgi:hypothetical protein
VPWCAGGAGDEKVPRFWDIRRQPPQLQGFLVKRATAIL